MPSLIQNYKEKETVAKLKKVYSTISQGYLLAVQENETIDNWGIDSSNTTEVALKIVNVLKNYIRITRICDTPDGNCMPNPIYDLYRV